VVPYDARPLSFGRLRDRFPNPWDERFFVPAFFGVGWTTNLSRAPRHSVPELAAVAFVLRRTFGGR